MDLDLPSQEVEIPMPLNSKYAGAHVHGHVPNMFYQHQYHDQHHDKPSPNHLQVSSSNGRAMPMTQNHENRHRHHDHVLLSNNKKQQEEGKLRYRECLKNHAASMGGNVTDGCGEFMPSGEEGTIEALTCSVCNCHRNFHRKEVEGDCYPNPPPHLMINNRGRKVINLGHHQNMLSPAGVFGVGLGGYPTTTAGALVSGGRARSGPIIPYNMGSLLVSSDQSDDQEEGGGGGGTAAPAGVTYMGLPPAPQPSSHHHNQMLKKRFRTKFTPEQKEKMFNFAEKVGWKIQKQEESVVQQLCQEIGVKRRVLKVWMHNNKHNLTKKNSSAADA